MKKHLSFYILLMLYSSRLFSQEKMVIEESSSGSTYYEGFAKNVKSLDELPSKITVNLKGTLGNVFGDLTDSITFEKGQIVDLKRYFAKQNESYKRQWLVPKYDLNFVLGDTSLGLTKYNIHIRLDEYGQLIEINWPRKGYNARSNFINRKEIERFALKFANKKGFTTTGYNVEFRFNDKYKELCWIFKFPLSLNQFNTFEIAAVGSIEVLEEYKSVHGVVN